MGRRRRSTSRPGKPRHTTQHLKAPPREHPHASTPTGLPTSTVRARAPMSTPTSSNSVSMLMGEARNQCRRAASSYTNMP